jgi:selenocysteine lyase/cysteine desulfurase
MEAVLADWRRGCAEPEAYDAPVTRSRVALARLLDAPPDSVATGATASGLIGLLPMSAVQSVNGALVHFAAVRAAAGVRTARRAGATRFSFHLYTDLSDVDSMVAAIKGQS